MDPFESRPQPEQPEQQEFLSPGGFAAPGTGVEELQQQFLDLRTLVNAALVGLVTLGLAADLFFGKQMLLVRRQIEEQAPNFNRTEIEFKRNRDPEIRRFMDELHRYAAAHPEYRSTILDRYRFALPQYFNSGVPGNEPTPIPQTPAPLAPVPTQGTNASPSRPAGR